MKKYKIGIYGSAVNNDNKIDKKAIELAKALSNYTIDAITGACTGIPLIVAKELSKNGIHVYGYSHSLNRKQHKKDEFSDNITAYKDLYFVPENFEHATYLEARKKYRNVVSTAKCNGAIIISGRWGTLNEFTNLHDMGKVIGVLTGTGGIADELKRFYKKINKKTKAKVFFNSSPKDLVDSIINELEKRQSLLQGGSPEQSRRA